MKDTGGPAFPTNTRIGTNKDGTWVAETPAGGGMTLRDYFAAKAMHAMIASGTVPTGIMLDTAKEAYQMADEMLKAREQ